MPRRRVYLPIAAEGLRELLQRGQLGPAPLNAFAAPAHTPANDLDEAEHQAWLAAAAAARASARGIRRVIASADVDGALVSEASDQQPASSARAGATAVPCAVEVDAPVPLRRFVAFHIDEHVGSDDYDLLWYDVTEIAGVLAILEG